MTKTVEAVAKDGPPSHPKTFPMVPSFLSHDCISAEGTTGWSSKTLLSSSPDSSGSNGVFKGEKSKFPPSQVNEAPPPLFPAKTSPASRQ